MKTRLVTIFCVAAIIFMQTSRIQAAESVSAEAVALDLLVVRPVAFAATAIGSALFVVALPFALMSKSTKQTANALVAHPARVTFTRGLGDLSDL